MSRFKSFETAYLWQRGVLRVLTADTVYDRAGKTDYEHATRALHLALQRPRSCESTWFFNDRYIFACPQDTIGLCAQPPHSSA